MAVGESMLTVIMLMMIIKRITIIMVLSLKIMLIRINISNSSNLEKLSSTAEIDSRHLVLVTTHNLVSVDPNQTGWTDIRNLVIM